MTRLPTKENTRQKLQSEIDGSKDHHERNRLGQFATPWPIASQMLAHAAAATQHFSEIRFLDPAIGTGVFYSALLEAVNPEQISTSTGYEIDEQFTTAARKLWADTGLKVMQRDFTKADPKPREPKPNLIICNPPYVRHHYIDQTQKEFLATKLQRQGYMGLTGLAGLYAYFVALTHPWMEEGALAGWLIPSEFMDVNYGEGIRQYLTNRVTLHHIHRFDPENSQFEDALVSSAIVWFTNNPPPQDHQVRMTFGGSLQQPAEEQQVPLDLLRSDHKWSKYPGAAPVDDQENTTLGDLFRITRGIATGNNDFFIIPEQTAQQLDLPLWALKRILPGPRALNTTHVSAREDGSPDIPNRLYLVDSDLDERTIAETSAELAGYLQTGYKRGVPNGYLCDKRTPWYSQEQRPPAPFLSTYLGRIKRNETRPFRFIMNDSLAIAHNVYLMMYPIGALARSLEENPALKRPIWNALNQIDPRHMIEEGRVYGGGLRKLEPKELGRLPAQNIVALYE